MDPAVSAALTYTVPETEHLKRLDSFLSDAASDRDLSRSFVQKLIKEGQAAVNGKTVLKPSFLLNAGDAVSFEVPEAKPAEILPQEMKLDILYEDSDVLVINKPKGMVVHPAAGHADGTLVNAVMYHCLDSGSGTVSLSGIGGVLRPGIVHRIDKDTTGSVIVCKNDAAHQGIAAQLKAHSIVRRYYALVYGVLEEDMTIDAPLGRDPKDRKKIAIRRDGKRAVTHVHILRVYPAPGKKGPDSQAYTLVECALETGRTHQIRVHLSANGHPIVGDEVYGSRRKSPFDGEGQYLHAAVLEFVHPRTGEMIRTKAPLPERFADVLRQLDARCGYAESERIVL